MKSYKPLFSSAPASSILNARTFRYTSSVATDIRKTFAKVLRSRAKREAQLPDELAARRNAALAA